MQYRKLNFYVLFIKRLVCCIQSERICDNPILEDPKYLEDFRIEKQEVSYFHPYFNVIIFNDLICALSGVDYENSPIKK